MTDFHYSSQTDYLPQCTVQQIISYICTYRVFVFSLPRVCFPSLPMCTPVYTRRKWRMEQMHCFRDNFMIHYGDKRPWLHTSLVETKCKEQKNYSPSPHHEDSVNLYLFVSLSVLLQDKILDYFSYTFWIYPIPVQSIVVNFTALSQNQDHMYSGMYLVIDLPQIVLNLLLTHSS